MNPLRVVFADASFFIAAFNARDEWHARALLWQQKVITDKSQIVTTEAVLWEWLSYYAAPSARGLAFRRYQDFHRDRLFRIVSFELALVQDAVKIFGSHSDKEWGMTDCLSFAVMARHSIDAALTSDHHFEQAGYAALLLREPSAS